MPLELDGLALILVGLFGDIAVKQRVVLVLDLYDRRIDIKRQRVFDIVLLCRAVGVFIKDVDAAVRAASLKGRMRSGTRGIA